jgi:NitT/TauT family transport system substrate-binding protein
VARGPRTLLPVDPDRGEISMRDRLCRGGLIAALVAGLVLALAGCGGDDSSKSGGGGSAGPKTITVGTLPIANAAPMYLGMQKGFFEAEGLKIKPHVGEGGAALIPALMSNQDQFAFVGVIPAITAVAKSLPIKIVTSSDDAAATEERDWQTLVVPKGSSIHGVDDLPGKTIAVNALRGLAEVVISRSLEKQGVDYHKVKLLEIPFPEMPAALEDHRVDAALLTEPFLSAVLARGGTQIDAPSVETLPSFPNGVYVASAKYIQQNADVVDRFSRAMNKSLDYAQAHPDEVRKIIPTFTKTPAAAAAKLRLPAFDSKLDQKGIELEAQLTAKYGIIEKAPAYGDMVRSGSS